MSILEFILIAIALGASFGWYRTRSKLSAHIQNEQFQQIYREFDNVQRENSNRFDEISRYIDSEVAGIYTQMEEMIEHRCGKSK